jgi:hypothetical protein
MVLVMMFVMVWSGAIVSRVRYACQRDGGAAAAFV